jgi:phosphatidylglycerophosphatase A
MKDFIIRLTATGLYSGYSPFVPGSVGTIPAWLVAVLFIRDNTTVLIPVVIVTFFVSVWAATGAEKLFGHDARRIVIDEWAGMFVAVLLVPYSLLNFTIAFVAFRILDAIKIAPAAQAEKLPAGWGVTMDDIVAGIQANIVTQIVIVILARLH